MNALNEYTTIILIKIIKNKNVIYSLSYKIKSNKSNSKKLFIN